MKRPSFQVIQFQFQLNSNMLTVAASVFRDRHPRLALTPIGMTLPAFKIISGSKKYSCPPAAAVSAKRCLSDWGLLNRIPRKCWGTGTLQPLRLSVTSGHGPIGINFTQAHKSVRRLSSTARPSDTTALNQAQVALDVKLLMKAIEYEEQLACQNVKGRTFATFQDLLVAQMEAWFQTLAEHDHLYRPVGYFLDSAKLYDGKSRDARAALLRSIRSHVESTFEGALAGPAHAPPSAPASAPPVPAPPPPAAARSPPSGSAHTGTAPSSAPSAQPVRRPEQRPHPHPQQPQQPQQPPKQRLQPQEQLRPQPQQQQQQPQQPPPPPQQQPKQRLQQQPQPQPQQQQPQQQQQKPPPPPPPRQSPPPPPQHHKQPPPQQAQWQQAQQRQQRAPQHVQTVQQPARQQWRPSPPPPAQHGARGEAQGAAPRQRVQKARMPEPVVIAFDLETTGLVPSRDRIIQVAARCVHSGDTWDTFVNPGRVVLSPKVKELTRITEADLSPAEVPAFGRAAAALEDFVAAVHRAHPAGPGAQVLLMAHNARRFDAQFLEAEYRRAARALPNSWLFLDTLPLARAVWGPRAEKPATSFSLQALCDHLGLPGTDQLHRADADVAALTKVYLSMIESEALPRLCFENFASRGRFETSWLVEKAFSISAPRQDAGGPHEAPARPFAGGQGEGGPGGGRTTIGELVAPAAEGRRIDAPLDELKGHRLPQTALKDKGFHTVRQLLAHYPRAYDECIPLFQSERCTPPEGVRRGVQFHTRGTVQLCSTRVVKKGVMVATVLVQPDWDWDPAPPSGPAPRPAPLMLRLTRFLKPNSHWFRKQFGEGTRVDLRGKLSRKLDMDVDVGAEEWRQLEGLRVRELWEVESPPSAWPLAVADPATGPTGKSQIYPIYAQKGDKLKSATFEKYIPIVQEAAKGLEDWVPEEVLEHAEITTPWHEAICHIHTPPSVAAAAEARQRLAFDELFLMQLYLLHKRSAELRPPSASARGGAGGGEGAGLQEGGPATELCIVSTRLVHALRDELRFTLTAEQERALGEVLADMAGPQPMLRLLQGDVGSGKTAVGLLAMMAAVGAGCQAALVAPTIVVARQHHALLERLLANMPVEEPWTQMTPVLLTGRVGAERRQICEGLRQGRLPLVVGTHAVLSKDVEFRKLGLVVIDEQQRFGVGQREASFRSSEAAVQPHRLEMTATPIPRSVAMLQHGWLALSAIQGLPPGRVPITTLLFTGVHEGNQEGWALRLRCYQAVRDEVAEGRKAYVVFPRIDASGGAAGAGDLKGAVAEFERLQQDELKGIPCGLLHGSMGEDAQAEAMQHFKDGRTQVLVGTTVMETGVDVPEATVMVVENAEQFGLRQLHQLRGRVGRAALPSFCFLLSSREDQEKEALQILEDTQDGFEVAAADLRLKGQGDILGEKQSGKTAGKVLRLANLQNDEELLESARAAAAWYLAELAANKESLPEHILQHMKDQGIDLAEFEGAASES